MTFILFIFIVKSAIQIFHDCETLYEAYTM